MVPRHLPEWQYFTAKKVSQRIFFVLSIIKFLLEKIKKHTGMDIDWSKRIIHLLDTHPFIPNFEKHMGLPTDWKQMELWR
jgi:abortive infection bacteriophage resistance protein